MQAKLGKIGDEFGLMLPEELVRACGFGSEATVTVRDNSLVVTPRVRNPREGWAGAQRAIPQTALDADFKDLGTFRETAHGWDAHEWQWPEADGDEKI